MERSPEKPPRPIASSRPQSPSSILNIIRKTDSKRDGLLNRPARWLFDNQIGLSFNLITLLFLTHILMPNTRPYTSKFFTLSYFNQNTCKYAAGYDDFHFMAFCTVLFTGLRACVMEYILAPLARLWGLSKKREVTRFSEQAWMLIYYHMFWPLGMYIYYNSPYFLNMQELWTDWPQRELDGLMKGYILGQLSFWIQQVLVIHIEDRRKDHLQMLIHHFVTIALVSASYAYHQTRVANLILVLMDVVDLIFPLAKCFKYLGLTAIADILFGVFVVVWLLSRHVFYLMTCWSVYSDLPRLIESACYRGTAENLHGPFPVPHGQSHLFEPFHNPAGIVCFNDNIMFGFLASLLALQVLMFIWSCSIIQVVVRVLKGNGADDIRSDEEADMEEEEFEYEETQPLEEEVGVEAIDLRGWKRRTGASRVASTGGVSMSGHSTRKELLNRIGCEKQID
ncbi:hypothetical protein OIDMADRAFT_167214 [Oidiodendron maius Zn]|uniref:TLC domain-containing protein n=1 Tax=Oidiodendron maius (strain Zn) TaxID=913774 RepID=A0A0C3CHD1_OIDMZ|nr:hypothetical protein OIDMADRAFT_167214 [Oidiodendron maius Zn]